MPDPVNTLDLEPVTNAVLFAVARLGFVVNIGQDGEVYVATAHVDGETFIAQAPDAYATAIELAGQDRA